MNMRRQIICLLVCALFLAGPALAARNWTTQESSASTLLNGVFFTDYDSGRAVGDSGVIIKTTDKGDNWAAEVSGAADNLNAIYLTSSTEGWAVGGALRTVHLNGAIWTSAKIVHTADIDLTGVFMTGTSTIFASAGTNFAGGGADFRNLFYSRDGGASWSSANLTSAGDDPTSSNVMQSVFFVNAQLGFVCGQNDTSSAGKIFRTTDEGTTWTDVSPSAANIAFNDIGLVNTLEGWCVGTDPSASPRTGYIYHTLDGGATWLLQHTTTSQPVGFRRVSAASSSDAWAASDQGQIFRYDGTSWTEDWSVPSPGYFTSVHFINPSNGWAVGGARAAEGGPQRLIYKYVVDPYNLNVDKKIYISGTSTEVTTTNIAISGVNIQPDSQLTVEAASGLVISSYASNFNSTLNAYKIDATITVDPASAEAGRFLFYVTNPAENTLGTAGVTVEQSPAPTEKPAVVPLPEGVFNPSAQTSVDMQIATPGEITGTTASGVHIYKGGKTRFPGVSGSYVHAFANVELELILYNFNNHQIAYRKKFTADPSGYTTVTLQKVNDLGLNVAEGMYKAVVIHPKFGQIGSGILVVSYR